MSGRFQFSKKAVLEMDADGLTEFDIAESILNAVAIHKKIRSRSPYRARATEYLYVIQSTNLDGVFIYTKGKFLRADGAEIFYFMISARRSIRE